MLKKNCHKVFGWVTKIKTDTAGARFPSAGAINPNPNPPITHRVKRPKILRYFQVRFGEGGSQGKK